MWSRDCATNSLAMQILGVKPGYAMMSMPVRADMVNGHDICHGGYIFTLADSAFAYACNSYNQNTVASACHIDFLAPAKEGNILEAEAVERSLSGRNGVYDVTVRTRGGKTIALFRGNSGARAMPRGWSASSCSSCRTRVSDIGTPTARCAVPVRFCLAAIGVLIGSMLPVCSDIRIFV